MRTALITGASRGIGAAIAAAIGELDVLVHNAGVFFPGPVAESTVNDWRDTLEVNVVGPVAITLALLSALRRTGGQVVFINSSTGRKASATMASYSASKFALPAFACTGVLGGRRIPTRRTWWRPRPTVMSMSWCYGPVARRLS